MCATARLKLPDDKIVEVAPGAVIGRHHTADLRINDPRISEAHAFVSLRGSALRLLALRGRLEVDGEAVGDIELRRGMQIWLADGLELEVLSVELPWSALAIEGPGIARQVLPHVASLCGDELELGLVADADAVFWTDGHVHYLRRPERPDVVLAPGEISVAGRTLRVVELPLRAAAADATVPSEGRRSQRLTIALRFDTVHVYRGDDVIVIDGLAARMMTELAQMGAPVEWETLARLLWPDEAPGMGVRRRYDATLTRLRRRLREAGLPMDLVRADGRGRIELVLGPRDVMVDEA